MAVGSVNIVSNRELLIKFDNYISNNVITIEEGLIRTAPTPLSAARNYLSATTIGDYALFGGGSYPIMKK